MQKTLLLLLLCLLFQCRSVKKSTERLDSSYTQTSAVNEAYERAIITEYVEIPVEKIIERPGQVIRDTVRVSVPKLIRQTVYEKSSWQQDTEMEAEIKTDEKVIEKKGQPPWIWIAVGSMGTLLLFILMAIAILLLRKKVA